VGDCVGERLSEALPHISEGQERVGVTVGDRTYDVTRSPVERRDTRIVEVVLMRDITDLKEREQELELANERLEHFADVVSHDLRNPLTIAQGHVDLILEGEEASKERLESGRRSLQDGRIFRL